MITFNGQPTVIRKAIFSFLPQEDMRICRLVCKQWEKNINELLGPVFHSRRIIFNRFPQLAPVKTLEERLALINAVKKHTHAIAHLVWLKSKEMSGFRENCSFKLNFYKSFEDPSIINVLNDIETAVSTIEYEKSSLKTKLQELKEVLSNAKNDILTVVDEINLKKKNWTEKQSSKEHWELYMTIQREYHYDESADYRKSTVGKTLSELLSVIEAIQERLKNEFYSEFSLRNEKYLVIMTMNLNRLNIEVLPQNILQSATQLCDLEISQNKLERFCMKSEKLTRLIATNNLLNDLDLKHLKNLTELNLSGNKIKSIDLGSNINLINLNLSKNPIQINELDLSKNKNLQILDLSENSNNKSKSSLDLTNNGKITTLNLRLCSGIDVTISSDVSQSQFQCDLTGSNNINLIFEEGEGDLIETDEDDSFAPLNDGSVDSTQDEDDS